MITLKDGIKLGAGISIGIIIIYLTVPMLIVIAALIGWFLSN